MSKSERKAEKKKKRKQKKLEAIEKQLQAQQVEYDIINLLKSEQLDTKPNLAKFLKTYVKEIRGLNANSKISFYPWFKFELSKVFVKFLDEHELVFDLNSDGSIAPIFYFYYKLDEIQLKKTDENVIIGFFQKLFDFGFCYDTSLRAAVCLSKKKK